MQLNQTHVCEENEGGEAAEISESKPVTDPDT